MTFEFSVDFFTGETGYFKVKGHDGVQPTLQMELNTVYVFDQNDSTNWFHPPGLAYQPDGAHDVLYGPEGGPEVADGTGTQGYTYVYRVDGKNVTLDDYEPMFFWPKAEWAKHTYSIEVSITEPAVAKELVYFCHIHNRMSGLIQIRGGIGSGITVYAPSQPDGFDTLCGTSDRSQYAKGGSEGGQCTSTQAFLCGAVDTQFAQCMEANDCKMNHEMSVANDPSSPVATFMHQMIPHHVNAVNMARILLKESKAYGGPIDMAGNTDQYDGVQDMLVEVVNTQNYQISEMRKWLLGHRFSTTGTPCNATAAQQGFPVLVAAQPASTLTVLSADGSGSPRTRAGHPLLVVGVLFALWLTLA